MAEKITEWALAVLPGSVVLLLVVFSALCFGIWRALSKLVAVHESSLKCIDQLASINEKAIKNQSTVMDDHIKLNDKLKVEIISLEKKIAAMSEEMTREKSASNELAIRETRALSAEFEKFRLAAHQTRRLIKDLSSRLEAIEKPVQDHSNASANYRDRMTLQTRAITADVVDEKALAEASLIFKAQVTKLERKRRWSNFPLSLVPMEGASELKEKLELSDLTCSIYFSGTTRSEEDFNANMFSNPEDHVGIWLGHRVPLDVIKASFPIVLQRWSFLRFIRLSTDGVPDYVHDQILFGGAVSVVKRDDLKMISDAMFAQLLASPTLAEFHAKIHMMNR